MARVRDQRGYTVPQVANRRRHVKVGAPLLAFGCVSAEEAYGVRTILPFSLRVF